MNAYKIVSRLLNEMSAANVSYARNQIMKLKTALTSAALNPIMRQRYQTQLRKYQDIILRFGHLV